MAEAALGCPATASSEHEAAWRQPAWIAACARPRHDLARRLGRGGSELGFASVPLALGSMLSGDPSIEQKLSRRSTYNSHISFGAMPLPAARWSV